MRDKILYLVMLVTIILGIIIIAAKGFNYSIIYSEHKRLEIIIGKEYEINDAKKIVNETIKSNHIVRKATLFETSLFIDAKEFNDDEITNLFTKLNEKYSKSYSINDLKKDKILDEMEVGNISEMTDSELNELSQKIKEKYNLEYTIEELKSDSTLVHMSDVNKIDVWTIIKGLIKPFIISLIIIAIYYAIRYKSIYKYSFILAPLKLILKLILSEAFILSVIAIARIPISNYLPTLLITVWILQLMAETLLNEKNLNK